MTTAADRARVGFFGKLPSRGDFVRVGLSRAFADAWDQWLQTVPPEVRRAFGQGWADAWSRMPAWRFSFAAGLCGPTPMTGVWPPSADRVGRCFPLPIAAQCATANDAFLGAAERIGLAAIQAALAPDDLAQSLSVAPSPLPASAPAAMAMCWWRPAEGGRCDRCSEAWPDADAFIGMLAA